MASVLLVIKDPTKGERLRAAFTAAGTEATLTLDLEAANQQAALRSWNCVLLDDSFLETLPDVTFQWSRQCREDRCAVALLGHIATWQGRTEPVPSGCELVLFPELGFSHVLQGVLLLIERKQLQRDMHEIEKLALVGTVSAGVLHEVKNPLNNVLGGMDRVLALVEDQPAAHRWAALIRRNGELLRDSLTDLLGGFRDEDILAPVEIHVLLDRAVSYVLKGDVNHRAIAVERDYLETSPPTLGSPGHLLHLFLNLIVNARQAIDSNHGVITLRTTNRQEEPFLVIDVEDNGPGIPHEILGTLFETSRTTKVGGSGFGLLFCRKIVDRHRGTIEAENLPSGGARFRVRLPREAIPTSTPDAKER